MTFTIERNIQYGSIEIYFEGKPAQAIRDALKLLRFRWHGIKKCWYGFAEESTVRNTIIEACEGEDNVVTDGYMGAIAVYGSKSHLHLYGSDLSAAIRADLKQAGIKGVTVSCKTYAGGQSITATVKATRSDLAPYDEYLQKYRCANQTWIVTSDYPAGLHSSRYWEMDEEQRETIRKAAAEYEYNQTISEGRHPSISRLDQYPEYTKAFADKLRMVDKIICAYRYNDSNAMVDYFDTNFHYSIKVSPIK